MILPGRYIGTGSSTSCIAAELDDNTRGWKRWRKEFNVTFVEVRPNRQAGTMVERRMAIQQMQLQRRHP